MTVMVVVTVMADQDDRRHEGGFGGGRPDDRFGGGRPDDRFGGDRRDDRRDDRRW